MRELMNTRDRGMGFRTCLLANVSSLALLGLAVATNARAASGDEDQSTVWIELGGQFERMEGTPEILSPPFFGLASPANLAIMTGAQRPPPYSLGENGRITFAPEGTDWVLSASIHYGRSNSAKHLHYQKNLPHFTGNVFSAYRGVYKLFSATPSKAIMGDGQTDSRASHTILDFQAGKDVGLGLFAARGSSVVSAGVRFAQFTASSDATIHARPVVSLGFRNNPPKYNNFPVDQLHQTYTAILHSKRNAQAVGPSLSWDASQPFAGNGSDMTLNFDWGMNAAVLFGRQSTQVHHQTTGNYYHHTGRLFTGAIHTGHYVHGPYDHNRSRTVTIPNVGAFAGVSLKFPNIRFSLGYRADFFFGAMDGGLDTRHTTDQNFFGPFATISLGFP